MKQALHIFLKDARRLRLQIAMLMLAIAWFAVLDIRWSARNAGGSGSLIIEIIVAATTWLLIARTVHEESLHGDDEFWLTRPYERGSLLGAKIMMTVCVVGVPLFVADCTILSVQSLTITGNLGGLILRQLMTATWLILPPFAIASMTRTITEDAMVWLALLALGGLTYFPGVMNTSNDFRAANEKYALVCALVFTVAALWRQYSRRGTMASRAMFAAAVLLPALPFPESMALGIEQLRNKAETSDISLTTKAQSVAEPPAAGYSGDTHCAPIPLAVGGVQAGWRLAVLSQSDRFESAGKTWSTGWYQSRPGAWHFNRSPAEGDISACASSAGLREFGVEKPLAVQVSLALAVFAEEPPIRVRATRAPFDVPGIGTCQFQPYVQDSQVLSCKAPVWLPPAGIVAVTGQAAWSSPIVGNEYPWAPLNFLPGMSPVYKWITMAMDEGTPESVGPGEMARFGLQNLIRANGEIEFRPERRIAVLRREIDVKEARFLGSD